MEITYAPTQYIDELWFDELCIRYFGFDELWFDHLCFDEKQYIHVCTQVYLYAFILISKKRTMVKPHKHHLALAITIIIEWNTSAAGLATKGFMVILANCALPTATWCASCILTLVIAAIIILTAWAIRQVAIAEITVRVTRNVLHAIMQIIGAIGVRQAGIQVGIT